MMNMHLIFLQTRVQWFEKCILFIHILNHILNGHISRSMQNKEKTVSKKILLLYGRTMSVILNK